MDLTRLLMRLALWLRRPPSRSHIILIAVVVAVSLAIAAIEHVFGWPDWLQTERVPIRRM